MRLAALLALGFALPVAAQEGVYMPMCLDNNMTAAELRFFRIPANTFFGYDVLAASPGIALYRANVPSGEFGDELILLEHCETGTRLVATLDSQGLSQDAHLARAEAVWDAWVYRARETNDSYSFDDLAEIARALGAQTRTDQAGFQSCACATPEADRW